MIRPVTEKMQKGAEEQFLKVGGNSVTTFFFKQTGRRAARYIKKEGARRAIQSQHDQITLVSPRCQLNWRRGQQSRG